MQLEKKISLLLVTLLCCMSCDDGDIIVTSFEFEEADVQLCQGSQKDEFVFFKINTQLNEAISLNFIDSIYSETTVTQQPISVDLAEKGNSLVYRQFNKSIDAAYYCGIVPDSSIDVTNESVSSKGIAEIEVRIVEQNDNDGVPALDNDPTVNPVEIEDLNGNGDPTDDDTDGDKIPNYVDQDDDNDNILTSAELPNGIADDNSYLDTDEDGIPNYRDEDDDNDGILTRNEDIDDSGNPRDDDTDGDGIPNFLDPDDDGDGILTQNEVSQEFPDPRDLDTNDNGIPDYLDTNSNSDNAPLTQQVEPLLKNTIETTFRTEINIFNLEFNQNSDQFNDGFFDFGIRDKKNSKTTEPN